MAEQDGDKTEAPTPRRRQEAREQGNIARSPDVTSAALMLAMLALLSTSGARLAMAMRSIIVDFARQKLADRRGGAQPDLELDTDVAATIRSGEEEVVRVHDALLDLAQADERLVRVVEMRYFGGLTEDEIATALGVTDRTVRRDWEKARLLLSLALA